MDLKIFPPEILDLILGNTSSSYHLIRLWKCGNRLLNLKLLQGASFLDLRAFKPPSPSVPKFVLDLPHLQHLSLFSHDELIGNANAWHSLVRLLPASLKSLKLESPDIGPWLATLSSDYPTTMSSSAINLAQSFPTLETLILRSFCAGTPSLKITEADFIPDSLPPRLTYLGMNCIAFSPKTDLKARLPQSLLVLDATLIFCYSNVSLDVFHNQFPPNLHTIQKICISSIEEANYLPRSLVNAEVDYPFAHSVWTLARSKAFPPKLRQLNLKILASNHFDGVHWASYLPQSLTELRLSQFAAHQLGPTEIKLLPSSLRTLSISSTLPDPILWTAIEKHFESEKRTNSSVAFWPPALTSLQLDLSTMSYKHMKLLPSSLLELEIYIDPISGETTVSETIDFLPPCLTHLRICPHRFHPQCFRFSNYCRLPQSLRSLILPFYDAPDFSLIPPSVTRLEASFSGTLSHASLETLPHSITRLSLSSERSAVYTCTSFPTLPHLTHLHLKHIEVPTLILRHLPRSMRSLSLAFSSSSIHAQDFEFIPPNLDHFDHGNTLEDFFEYLGSFWPLKSPIQSQKELPPIFVETYQKRFSMLINGEIGG